MRGRRGAEQRRARGDEGEEEGVYIYFVAREPVWSGPRFVSER